nr:uncharacterized protein LOC117996218 isoform X2 [Maniola hyperantus]
MLAHILFCVTVLIRVVLVFRTSACLHRNEEYSLCGWKCPPTCINLRLLAKSDRLCPLRWECRVGCRCSAGYIRDEYSQDCVYIHNCPDKDECPPGQIMGANLQCITQRRTTVYNESLWQYYGD